MNSQTYHYKHKHKNNIYYRCGVRKCKRRITYNRETDEIIVTQQHNHDHDTAKSTNAFSAMIKIIYPIIDSSLGGIDVISAEKIRAYGNHNNLTLEASTGSWLFEYKEDPELMINDGSSIEENDA
ncbi:unnamed protein product [Blepharisma stoltei]|uniref:FLYWCH-type domain-containing protein n=1 Tax=Blepharisma stoltei TaxID=1481888 RepID=A0AAU9JZ50_9CILI|nr:unnamed protein product [Blepharisma stoltei]